MTLIRLNLLLKNHQAKRLVYFGAINLIVTSFLLYISHSSQSLALTAFTYLTIFDMLSLLSGLVSIWVKIQVPNSAFPYGFKRCEVLAIFSTAILTILSSFFVIKEGAESLFEEKEVHTSRLLPAIFIGFIYHVFLTLVVKTESLEYVIRSSSSSWLQEHMFDISESTCKHIPGLSKLLLPRANPIILIGLADLIVLSGSYFLLQMGSSYLIDTYASILIAIMTIGTMLPFAVYTGKILLQTTPSHLITQLDKLLREASTLDGVLEFRDEHFWTLSFGVLAGSLHVRVRRDADEQLVLAHVWNKLAGLVQILTIHIFKDDWMRRTTHQLVYNQQNVNFPLKPSPNLSSVSSTSSALANQTYNSVNDNYTHINNNLSQNSNINLQPLNQTKEGLAIRKSADNQTIIQKSNNGSSLENDFVIINP